MIYTLLDLAAEMAQLMFDYTDDVGRGIYTITTRRYIADLLSTSIPSRSEMFHLLSNLI